MLNFLKNNLPMNQIRVLPYSLVNKIAAGEIVERPASVVKELIENSIDSGATHIEVDVEKGGVQLIRVFDNGCGIDKKNLQFALAQHATSKIKSLADLENINTLGFRGEALASINSVSRLTLKSCVKNQAVGWSICSFDRNDVKISPVAHPCGTTVEVRDLFFSSASSS